MLFNNVVGPIESCDVDDGIDLKDLIYYRRSILESTGKYVSTKPTIELRTQTNRNIGTQSNQVRLAIRRHQSPSVQSANSRLQTRNQ